MKKITLRANTLVSATLFVVASMSFAPVTAQQQEMSLDELEQYIEEQKVALDEAIASRDETESKVKEVQEALAEQEARRAQLEEEVDELCTELDEAEPGSYEDCKAEFSG